MLHIRLLGNFHLVHNGEPITGLETTRLQSLVAYLVLHRDTPQSRRHLAFLFWPDSTEAQARTNLRHLLHNLHRTLPEVNLFLQVDAQMLQWRPDVPFTLDIAEFEAALSQTASPQALQTAAEIYQGELLPSCYDDWIIPERERLHQKYIEVLEQLTHQLEERREYTQALTYGQRLLQVDPLREETYRLLMRLHALRGNRTEALQVYRHCADVLERELGITPSLVTKEIYQRLVSQEAMPESRPSPIQGRMLVLVGREMEWRQLMGAWQRVSQGEPHCVLVKGEAGIGKTRLTEELQAWAERQGITTARSRAYAATCQLAYGPIIAWLQGSLQAAWQGLEPLWLTELARLLPELLSQHPDLSPPQPLTDSWQRGRLFEALVRAMLAARPPCLLLLDDLQWCDEETLEWLGYLLHAEPAKRLLLVGTVRTEEVDEGHPLMWLRQNLRQSGRLDEMELGPLDAVETAQLAEQVAAQPLTDGVVEGLYRETEGNPLFIVEIVRANQGHNDLSSIPLQRGRSASGLIVPSKVRTVIEARLAQLSPQAREMVNLAAVIGREFSFELLRATMVAEDQMLVAALEEAERKRILREQGLVTYDFSHDKLREITYTGLSTARRRLLHSLVAGALERLDEGNQERLSSQLAYHYERAGMPELAVRYYWKAAQTARQICALPEMISYLQQGLALLEGLPNTTERAQQSFDCLLMLGATFAAQKGYAAPETGEAYERALDLAPLVGDTFKLVLVQYGLWMYHYLQANLPHIQQLAETILAEAKRSCEPDLLKLAYHVSGITLMNEGRVAEVRQYLEQSIDQTTDRVLPYVQDVTMLNHLYLSIVLWHQGYPDQARQQIKPLLTHPEIQNDPVARVAVLSWSAWLYYCLRELESVQKCTEEGLDCCTQYGLFYWQTIFHLFRGWAITKLAPTSDEILQMHQSLTNFLASGAEANLSLWQILLTEAYYANGQTKAGIDMLNKAIEYLYRKRDYFLEAEIYRLKGELLLAFSTNHLEEAEACFQHALLVARNQQAKSLELRVVMSLGRLWHAQGLSQKTQTAYNMLTEVYNWFTEGFNTPDLIEAKALLDELAYEL